MDSVSAVCKIKLSAATSFNSGAAKATRGPEFSDAGTSMTSFHSLDGSGIYAIGTWDLRDPSDIPDENLQELLDWAMELRG